VSDLLSESSADEERTIRSSKVAKKKNHKRSSLGSSGAAGSQSGGAGAASNDKPIDLEEGEIDGDQSMLIFHSSKSKKNIIFEYI